MCGRYRIKDTDQITAHLLEAFGIPPWTLTARYNAAPSQELPVVVGGGDGRARIATMRWGFVPSWDESEKPKLAPINARTEGAFAKPLFRQAIQRRRCLILADGFYEWQRLAGDRKQPFDIQLRGGRPFCFAGIYEAATATRPDTFLVFTTRPNSVMAPIHDRMPVILTGDRAREWLVPGPITAEQLTGFAEPYPAQDIVAQAIGSLVNSPRNDSPAVLGPAGPEAEFHLE
ncbi:MAG: SOS response-associated peptidase [Opitutaceae bacterium]|nr:SOS response-associated peptidase [Opitutaceae bacterium]